MHFSLQSDISVTTSSIYGSLAYCFIGTDLWYLGSTYHTKCLTAMVHGLSNGRAQHKVCVTFMLLTYTLPKSNRPSLNKIYIYEKKIIVIHNIKALMHEILLIWSLTLEEFEQPSCWNEYDRELVRV